MARLFKSIYRTKVNDIYIRADKIITPCKCIVTNCKETDCYDIQLEQPEGCSFIGGTFCQRHFEDVERALQGFLEGIGAPVNVGRWIDDKCSVCGKGIDDLIDSKEWYRNEDPNFCPFCGAKLIDSQESEVDE